MGEAQVIAQDRKMWANDIMALCPPPTHMGMKRISKYVGSKRHSLQAVELSRRLQTAVQIVSKPPAPSNGGPDLPFLDKPAMQTRRMAVAAPHKSG